jgi:ADP-heptose:LPS heptosyltransferase
MNELRSILVVRRDNIGDLVCTTPLIAALRLRYPEAWIGALVNDYNADVLSGNRDLSEVIAYTKLKHREAGTSALALLAHRFRAFLKLRLARLDCVVLASSAFSSRNLRLARLFAPHRIVGFSDGNAAAARLDRSVPQAHIEGRHEVERVFALAAVFGIGGEIPAPRVVPDAAAVRRAQDALGTRSGPCIALHLSARRPSQRWPVEHFAELAARLHQDGARVLVLWAPGPAGDPRHPGDDDKMAALRDRLGQAAPATFLRTGRLSELIGALAACDAVVCADGGASHLAAALGKPVVALFGDSPPERWRPWGAASVVLRPPSRDVRDISVEEALGALNSLGVLPERTPGSRH